MNRKQSAIAGFIVVLGIVGALIWSQSFRDSRQTSGNPRSPEQASDSSGSSTTAAPPLASFSTNSPDQAQPELLSTRTTRPLTEREAADQRKSRLIEGILSALGTPIAFHGRVVDQFGDPVSEAEIHYSAADKFNASGTAYNDTSDTEGLFSITDIKGMTLSVGVGKAGYYDVQGKSAMTFAYASDPSGHQKAPPTKDNPAVFLLWKMGETEPLVEVITRQFAVATDGQPTRIDLGTGKPNSAGSRLLQVESWIGDTTQDRFDWRFRVSIPGGGTVERNGQFDFAAPQDGYGPWIELNMASAAERWTSRGNLDFFASFSDGTFARTVVEFFPGKQNLFSVKSYLNPIPGHRNLEFDPAKRIKPPRGVSPNY